MYHTTPFLILNFPKNYLYPPKHPLMHLRVEINFTEFFEVNSGGFQFKQNSHWLISTLQARWFGTPCIIIVCVFLC